MSKSDISQDDQETIDEYKEKLLHINDMFSRLKTFSKGDYLIQCVQHVGDSHAGASSTKKPVFVLNSYGLKKKFKVVEIDSTGAPWIKELGSSGQPTGPIRCALIEEILFLDSDRISDMRIVRRFEIDPEYVDSLILGPDAYDPCGAQKTMSQTWKEITEHNKKHIKRFKTMAQAVGFFKIIKPGDQFWTSSKKYFTVIDVKTVSSRGTTSLVKGPYVTKLLVRYVDGSNKTMYPDNIVGKVLYTAAPRSYRREMNPNR
jgi:hypothetical protein